MRRFFLSTACALVAACASQDAPPAQMPIAGGSCTDLAKLALPNVTITKAELAGAGLGAGTTPGVDASKLASFCRVAATLKPTTDSDIRIEVWLPAQNWNGKFLGTGNGGAAGSIGYPPLADGITRGYAVAATDTGHQGGGADYSFAIGHPEKLADNAWRAVHEMTVTGKALTKAYYSASPKLSYWNACSTGGRQGLKEAQRFPTDYDAIIAGAPARAWPGLPALSIMMQNELTDPNGLPVSKLSALKEAAIKACDANDGVTDRVVNEPGKCKFDPAVTLCKSGDAADCLTSAQVASARRIYAGLRDPKTGDVIFPGMNPGSEPAWAGLAGAFKIGESYFRDVVHGDPSWKAAQFNAATDVPLAAKLDAGAMDASQPDLSAFFRRGGKLILYHGTTDGLIPTQSTIDLDSSFYRTKQMPSVIDASVKFFLIPGMDHCRGGEGASNADFLGAMEHWVEHGQVPSTIIASKSLPGGAARTRPLCNFPGVAKYSGSGSTDDAANFSCIAPVY
jgi:feruloyl esterase